MLAAESRKQPKTLYGSPLPRIAPPTPAKADVKAFAALAAKLGLKLYPWQETAARYLTAVNARGLPLYREVAVIVARQNGKTRLLLPLIVSRMLAGQRITHAAQHLRLPGEFHQELAGVFEDTFPEMLPSKRGISWRAGQESIRLTNGAVYQIVAATGGAPRGPSNDLVVIDELREMNDHRFLAGIKPTTIARPQGQLVYLSNAGTSESEVLNSLKDRSGADPSLAYLEWSAAPARASDDVAGWLEANPSIGHNPATMASLENEYRAHLLGHTMEVFETEHLCRWVAAMDERLVMEKDWEAQTFGDVGRPLRSYMAVNMDITGERASAAIAWQDAEGRVCVDVHDTTGSPIDVSLLGPDLMKLGRDNRVGETAFDPYTDADLARHLLKARGINGREYAAATEKFVRLVAERKLRVHDPDNILAEDLRWTVRRSAAMGSYMAVRANDEHTNTAAQAAIRAVWMASRPIPQAPARIY